MNATDLQELVDLLSMCEYPSLQAYVQRSTAKIFCFSAEDIAYAEDNKPIDNLPDLNQQTMREVELLFSNPDDFVELSPLETWESYEIMETLL